ncbi:dCTP deaminase [Picrophilus oshimae]|uniref:Deoxycytidine triphosphate deaminase n=1 Tax=Picrophilus torridus (strain ATCC 700027 / DSM 9790 / JCM 10055 / NBRC 100828 / KAW 2/3) TaxID=1122961 RepID=Q6L2T7_PICTO|nr:dCTP deaminase [Picrophilus oshimae]AAT42715.1 deoxycytidine triphosphate deaminase [Picrophilus oshimae DSM 9789]
MLNDLEIINMAKRSLLISKNFDEKCLTPNGYDLRINDIIPGNDIKKGTVFFVSSYEEIKLPDNIIGLLFIRSSFARKGIFGSFGVVDAGYMGNLTLSFYNALNDVKIERYERIVQIVFERIEKPEKTYSERSGNYYGKSGINL